jgi:hypothetical protein
MSNFFPNNYFIILMPYPKKKRIETFFQAWYIVSTIMPPTKFLKTQEIATNMTQSTNIKTYLIDKKRIILLTWRSIFMMQIIVFDNNIKGKVIARSHKSFSNFFHVNDN